MTAWLQRQWYSQRRPSPALWLLLPLTALFVMLSGLRRMAYRCGFVKSVRLPVPVIVVGNLVAGGAGKTPLVLWLAEELRKRGRQPGIVSRGYGVAGAQPRPARPDDAPGDIGDEPLLLARRSGVPVWVGRDRPAAGSALLAANPSVDLLIADDGLQHYRLARDAEVVVFDARGVGNGWRLPMGPLREPIQRLREVSAVVLNSGARGRIDGIEALPCFDMQLAPGSFYRLDDPAVTCEVQSLTGKSLHAVAGIGDPSRFFRTLEALGLCFTAHPFPDHHPYRAGDLEFGPDAVVLMTEKDAVKCRGLTAHETWVLPVQAQLPAALAEFLLEKINGR
ncbi:MAG: tetraacyldisaccharide 4'-kinase [Betaproteobacteria bacterium]